MDLDALATLIRGMPMVEASLLAMCGISLGLLCGMAIRRLLGRLAARTENEFDDQIVEEIAGPVALTIAGVALIEAMASLQVHESLFRGTRGLLLSVIVLAWGYAGWQTVHVVLHGLEKHSDRFSWVKPRTTPVFEMGGKTLVVGAAMYAFFLAWNVDLTAWLASAGILGIAVGFAAQETLGNVVAGLFILAEAPFKLGDWLELEGGVRGRVTEIGMRTTRLVTLDDIEVIVPNQVLANNQLVNESGGPYEKARIHVDVGVAYGSDIDHVKTILLEAAADCDAIERHPEPVVLFRQFGDSSLDFRLMVWAPPFKRPSIVDRLNTDIYKRFADEGVEIPFPQRDVWMRAP